MPTSHRPWHKRPFWTFPQSSLQDPNSDQITRHLSAAAFARPDRFAPALDWVADQVQDRRENVKAAIRKRSRLVRGLDLFRKERRAEPLRWRTPENPDVVIGDAYARWVRRRVKGARRPVPAFGFDQDRVFDACKKGARNGTWRWAAATVAAVVGILIPASGVIPVWAVVLVLPIALWLVYFADRYIAQHMVHKLLTEEPPLTDAPDPRPDAHVETGVAALPYRGEREQHLSADRFIGAGLEVLANAHIDVDIDKGAGTRPPHQQREPADPGGGSISVLSRTLGTEDRKSPESFTLPELYQHTKNELDDLNTALDGSRPAQPIDITGIWGMAHEDWRLMDDTTWDAIPTMKTGVPVGDDVPHPEVARPYIWVRVTDWSGQLIVSLLVRFELQRRTLRVIVIPQVMAPLVPEVAQLSRISPNDPRWLGVTLVQSLCDVVARPVRALAPSTRRRPELDRRDGPLSLREVYSKRRSADMHMKDDTMRHAGEVQRRVFTAVEEFLSDHGIDIAEYKKAVQQANYNFGTIINNSDVTGGVQNAPFGQHNAQQGANQ